MSIVARCVGIGQLATILTSDWSSRLPVVRSFYRSGASLGQETSQTLDYLLFESGYNRRVRPDTGGPVVVNVNLAIR